MILSSWTPCSQSTVRHHADKGSPNRWPHTSHQRQPRKCQLLQSRSQPFLARLHPHLLWLQARLACQSSAMMHWTRVGRPHQTMPWLLRVEGESVWHKGTLTLTRKPPCKCYSYHSARLRIGQRLKFAMRHTTATCPRQGRSCLTNPAKTSQN